MRSMMRVMLGAAGGGGGGGGGCGVVLATPYDDNFDCGSAIDTAGTRFSGANAWTKFALTPAAFVSEAIVSDEWRIENGSTGSGYSPIGAYQTMPAGNCTFKTYGHRPRNDNWDERVGMFLEESSTGKSLIFGAGFRLSTGQPAMTVGSSAAYLASTTIGSGWASEYAAYMRISRSGTNLVYEYSMDDSSWTTLLTHAETAHFTTTPDRIGICKQEGTPNIGFTYAYFAYFHKTA